MNEEIRKPGSEINEAALEGVSGGNYENLVYERFCDHCDRESSCNSGHTRIKELVSYINANGRFPSKCPFYND